MLIPVIRMLFISTIAGFFFRIKCPIFIRKEPYILSFSTEGLLLNTVSSLHGQTFQVDVNV